jgi:hypothetical protein
MGTIEKRWAIGSPAVPHVVRRTLAAATLLLVLTGLLALLAA